MISKTFGVLSDTSPILEGPSPFGKREKTHLSLEEFGGAPFQASDRWKSSLVPMLGAETEELWRSWCWVCSPELGGLIER